MKKLNDGNTKEPKKLSKEERLKLITRVGQRRQLLRNQQMQTAIEEGVDISEKIPEEYRQTFKRALEFQDDAVEGSEARPLGEVAGDVWKIIHSDEVGGATFRKKFNKADQDAALALQRLRADAKRLGKDINEVLRRNGFTDFEIGLVNSYFDRLSERNPRDAKSPVNTGIILDPSGDPIVKQRKQKGIERIPLRASEVKAIQDMPELKSDRWGWMKPTIRTFEQLGQPIKEMLYYSYRKAETIARRRTDETLEDVKAIRGGLSFKERARIGAYR